MRVGCWLLLGIATTTLCCASTPDLPQLDRTTVRSIKSGVTTLAQIEAWFGPPTDVEIKSSGVVWRYERRFRELERPGAIRHAVCGTIGEVPILQLPLLWFRQCEEIERREQLEVRFSAERIVIAAAFDESLDPYGFGRRRSPAGLPIPIPLPRVRSGSDVASTRPD